VKPIGDMSTREVLDEIRDFTDDCSATDFDRLEDLLREQARRMCLHPTRLPPRAVLATARRVKIIQSALP